MRCIGAPTRGPDHVHGDVGTMNRSERQWCVSTTEKRLHPYSALATRQRASPHLRVELA